MKCPCCGAAHLVDDTCDLTRLFIIKAKIEIIDGSVNFP